MRFDFSQPRLEAVLLKYVQDGPHATRRQRKEEVDACRLVLLSDAAEPLRVGADIPQQADA